MKFRKHDWLNTSTKEIIYSIQGNAGDGRGWISVKEDGRPLFFYDEVKRNNKLKELRKEYARRLS